MIKKIQKEKEYHKLLEPTLGTVSITNINPMIKVLYVAAVLVVLAAFFWQSKTFFVLINFYLSIQYFKIR